MAEHQGFLTAYLKEIGEAPLLDRNDEKGLAGRVQGGDPVARETMIRANLRLVVRVARSLVGRGVYLDDLIEEGNLGLIHAVERFNPRSNTRFSTYATYWIRQSMARCFRSARELTLPAYVFALLRGWSEEYAVLEQSLGRHPTRDEVNARLNHRPGKLGVLQKALVVVASKPGGSSEAALNLDELVAGQTNDGEDPVATRDLIARALYLLDRLDRRDSSVLRMRFGLEGMEPMTLAQVGKRLRLTRERVRQIENRALTELKRRLRSSRSQEEVN